jgi:hypothetical protein
MNLKRAESDDDAFIFARTQAKTAEVVTDTFNEPL